MKRRNLIILFIIYLILLIWTVVFKCGMPYEIIGHDGTLDPLTMGKTMDYYLHLGIVDRLTYDIRHIDDIAHFIIFDVLTNIYIFIPFGMLIPLINKKFKIWNTCLLSFLISLSIELFQLFTLFGQFSIVDLICNSVGSLLGGLILFALYKLLSIENFIKYANRICLICIIIFIPVILFALIYTGINFKYIIFKVSEVIKILNK